MYLAFVALYILTCVNFEQLKKELNYELVEIRTYTPPIQFPYVDQNNNNITFNDCGGKTCMIKCCADGKYLDDDGECQEEQYFSDEFKKRDDFGIEYWNEVRKEISDYEKRLSENFTFIFRVGDCYTRPERNFTTSKTEVLKGGELYYSLENSTRVYDVWKLRFCADHQIYLINTDKRVKFVYDISEVNKLPEFKKTTKVHSEYYVLGGGLLFTTLWITITICRLPKGMNQALMLYSLLAYFFSLFCAYGLKMVHMALLNSEMNKDDGCKVVSSELYTLLLSAFCWTLVLKYDSTKTVRIFRLTKKIMIESDIGVFFGYAMFAWGLPAIMTLIALAGDKYDIGFVPAPFDSCFMNENETMVYLHIPVSLLVIAQTTIFVIYAYDMWIVNTIIERSKLKGPRPFIFGKLVFLLLTFVFFINIPDAPFLHVPVLLFYIVCINIIIYWITYLFIFVNNIMLRCRRRSNNHDKEGEPSTNPNDSKISIISNNELDKKKKLNFSNNISMVKDHVMGIIMPHDYEKLLNDLTIDSNEDADNNDAEKNIGIDENLKNNDNITSNNKDIEKF